MTAGSVSVPQIIPLRPPRGHRKHVIDSNTEIVIKSGQITINVTRNLYVSISFVENVVFYTLNNKRPDPFQVYGEKYTYKFDHPFTLAPGKVTIKAMAMSQDCSKQSSVVTRTFVVHEGGERVESDTWNEQVMIIMFIYHIRTFHTIMYVSMCVYTDHCIPTDHCILTYCCILSDR